MKKILFIMLVLSLVVGCNKKPDDLIIEEEEKMKKLVCTIKFVDYNDFLATESEITIDYYSDKLIQILTVHTDYYEDKKDFKYEKERLKYYFSYINRIDGLEAYYMVNDDDKTIISFIIVDADKYDMSEELSEELEKERIETFYFLSDYEEMFEEGGIEQIKKSFKVDGWECQTYKLE